MIKRLRIWRLAQAVALGAALAALAIMDPIAAKEPQPVLTSHKADMYFYVDEWPVWIDSSIRYTVYDSTRVEARVLNVSDEIVLDLKEGLKAPGVYTLPFDGTLHGSPLAGLYKFELYFGDDYAAKCNIVVMPLSPGQ
jgi:hypothetical protein